MPSGHSARGGGWTNSVAQNVHPADPRQVVSAGPDGRAGIDANLVRRLLAAQFPQWQQLPVRPVEHDGWDNRTYRLGERLTVRLPTHASYAPAVAKEHRWLPVLAPRLPVPIPVPL